jgi:AraC-like DNA-binding protein
MVYLPHYPGPPLNELVDYFWLFAGGQAPRKERILPSGTLELVINLCEDEVRIHEPAQPERYTRFSGAVVSGTYSNAFICDARQHESMLGVHFKPGGAFPFLGALASELADAHVDLEDLWGQSARELRERLCAAPTPRKRFRIMEEVLATRLPRSPTPHRAVQMALTVFGRADTAATVRDVAREVGLSQRRFIQFKTQVGLTPKRLGRLLRFQRARLLAEQTEARHRSCREPTRGAPAIDWAQLALTCGYYDQSHLINEFREFSGFSPTEYLLQHQPDGRLKDNHVPLPQAG